MNLSAEEATSLALLNGANGKVLSRRGQVRPEIVELAIDLIDRSELPEALRIWRGQDKERLGLGTGGRPGAFDDRGVLVLLLILAIEHSPLLVSQMAELVTQRLSHESLARLGLDTTSGSPSNRYDQIWRRLHSILDLIDPFPINASLGGDRRRLMSKDEAVAILARRDPAEQARKKARLHEFTNALVDATVRLVPRHIRRRWKGNTCIDATFVAAFGKRGSTKASRWHSIEPDAGWYTRQEDHADGPDSQGRKRKRIAWGWEAHIAVMAQNTDGNRDFPLLALAMSFDRPGVEVAENAMAIYRTISSAEHPIGIAASDRAYFPGAHPDKYQQPMRELGFGLIGDYRKDQLGRHGAHQGAIQIEGGWYCPSTPQPLIDATVQHRAGAIDEATWRTRLAQRDRYRFKPKAKPDRNGAVRLMCPAETGSAACPLKPKSYVPGRTRIELTPEHPGPVCEQQSVTFPAEVGAKLDQTLRFGSPEWASLYASARNTIEGFNAQVKDGNRQALADPSRRRVRGRTAATIFTALLIASTNISKLQAFMESTADGTPTLRNRRPRPLRHLAEPTSEPQPQTAKDPPAA